MFTVAVKITSVACPRFTTGPYAGVPALTSSFPQSPSPVIVAGTPGAVSHRGHGTTSSPSDGNSSPQAAASFGATDGLGDADCVGEGLTLGLTDGETLGLTLAEGLALADGDRLAEGLGVGLALAEGL